MRKPQKYEVEIEKIIHGGQGLGTLPDGKKCLVWNALPGERVLFESRKKKASYIEGTAIEIIKASVDRIQPRDELYLSTSPWQMMTYEAENKFKAEILQESLSRAGVRYEASISMYAPETPWHYRGKMEYSFYGDENGLHLALFNRGTHRKQITTGSSIARPEIDDAAQKICRILNEHSIRAADLKSLMLRCNQEGQVVAGLFTRDKKFPKIDTLNSVCQGIAVYYSNPKSPASIITEELYVMGDTSLTDKLRGREIMYDAVSFFQVNLDPYSRALEVIADEIMGEVTDMYAGVGSIGLSVTANGPLKLVEADNSSAAMAKHNIKKASQYGLEKVELIVSSLEKSLEQIPAGTNKTVIFDPPRAGLHEKISVTTKERAPAKVIYLSCNPSTLARDLHILQDRYHILSVGCYNFFPRTPHIEALAILEATK